MNLDALVAFWRNIGHLVWFGAAVLAGAMLNIYSFQNLREMRQIERTPSTEIRAILPGEVNVSGSATFGEGELTSPHTRSRCVYYRYTKEKREKDSDGNTKWVTVDSGSQWVNFFVSDITGSAYVVPSHSVRFKVAQKSRTTDGRYRYTEHRIDPGDDLFIFGHAELIQGRPKIDFDAPGNYTPIISSKSEMSARQGMATISVFACWGGMLCLSLAVVAVFSMLKYHQLVLYLILVAMTLVSGLLFSGLRMTKLDLVEGYAQLERHDAAARTIIEETLAAAGLSWDGDWDTLGDLRGPAYSALPSADIERLRMIRIDLYRGIRRHNEATSEFPERLLAPLWGVSTSSLPELPADDLVEAEKLAHKFKHAGLHSAATYPPGVVAAILGIALSWLGFKLLKTKRYIENLPTSPSSGVVYGLAEIAGVIELPAGKQALKGPLTKTNCVQIHYKEEEKQGSSDKAKWVTVDERHESMEFLCRDDHGTFPVNPIGAMVMTNHKRSQTIGRRRYTESSLRVGDPLYALGSAEIHPVEMDHLVLGAGPKDLPFLLSNKPESDVMFIKARRGVLTLNFALASIILSALAMFGGAGAVAADNYVYSSVVALFYLILLYCFFVFNDMIFMRQRVRRDWANIDVSLKKRADLIPRLEAVVKGYFAHEAGLHESLVQMRDKYKGGAFINPAMAAEFLRSEESFLKSFMGLTEKYPNLKGDQQTAKLMDALVDMENEIALMREGYNEAVKNYNKRIMALPEVIFAKLFRFDEADFFSGDFKIRQAPTLSLD